MDTPSSVPLSTWMREHLKDGGPKGWRPKGSMAKRSRGEEETNDWSWEVAVLERLLKKKKKTKKIECKDCISYKGNS